LNSIDISRRNCGICPWSTCVSSNLNLKPSTGTGICVRDHRNGHEEDGGHVPAGRVPLSVARERARSADACKMEEARRPVWLSLEVTVQDGHDIFVDVREIDVTQVFVENNRYFNQKSVEITPGFCNFNRK
jgi:hypothetical protein